MKYVNQYLINHLNVRVVLFDFDQNVIHRNLLLFIINCLAQANTEYAKSSQVNPCCPEIYNQAPCLSDVHSWSAMITRGFETTLPNADLNRMWHEIKRSALI